MSLDSDKGDDMMDMDTVDVDLGMFNKEDPAGDFDDKEDVPDADASLNLGL